MYDLSAALIYDEACDDNWKRIKELAEKVERNLSKAETRIMIFPEFVFSEREIFENVERISSITKERGLEILLAPRVLALFKQEGSWKFIKENFAFPKRYPHNPLSKIKDKEAVSICGASEFLKDRDLKDVERLYIPSSGLNYPVEGEEIRKYTENLAIGKDGGKIKKLEELIELGKETETLIIVVDSSGRNGENVGILNLPSEYQIKRLEYKKEYCVVDIN